MKKKVLLSLLVALSFSVQAQFHTLNIPQSSPKVVEHQKIGVTDIIISYSSPALRGRDVWNNKYIIPQEGQPIAWRAGANMNTTISFSSDVTIEGKSLKAGTYGFHIIPHEGKYTLLFAHNNNQWGSYYLDIEKDVTLTVVVDPVSCPSSEQLDYEFLDRKENSLVIGLEWGEIRIPFTVAVDLKKTVVASFRSELRGINTYHWQAWNDAANWCLNHDTNLEEALEWANRSAMGGYNNFAANKNLTNLSTKIKILTKLDRPEDAKEVISEAKELSTTQQNAYEHSLFLIRNEYYQEALEYCGIALKNFPSAWSIELNRGIAYYFLKDRKAAVKSVKKVLETSPDNYSKRLNEIINEMETDTYKLPGR